MAFSSSSSTRLLPIPILSKDIGIVPIQVLSMMATITTLPPLWDGMDIISPFGKVLISLPGLNKDGGYLKDHHGLPVVISGPLKYTSSTIPTCFITQPEIKLATFALELPTLIDPQVPILTRETSCSGTRQKE